MNNLVTRNKLETNVKFPTCIKTIFQVEYKKMVYQKRRVYLLGTTSGAFL